MRKTNWCFCSILMLALAMPLSCSCKQKPVPEPDPKPNPDEIIGTPFDSRWELSLQLTNNKEFPWEGTHKCYATFGEGRSKSFFTAVSASGGELNFKVKENGPAVGGMKENDYLLFCVPIESLSVESDVDFMLSVDATSTDAPRDWQIEYFDGGQWTAAGEQFVINSSYGNHTTVVRNFTLPQSIVLDTLKVRCRACSSMNAAGGQITENSEAFIYLPPADFQTCWILTYPVEKFPKQGLSTKLMALGNSFSYYNAPVWMLKEIARTQGHQMELRMNVRPAQTFADHLSLPLTAAVIDRGGYDAAVLQDQSTQHSSYYKSPSSKANVLEDTRSLKSRILEKSPECKVVLENTWAFTASNYGGFGSYESFAEALTKGCEMISSESGCVMSPICSAFAVARRQGIGLTISDNKHQSQYGAYLKACVNYLVLFGGKFTETVSDCNLPPAVAAYLRSVAEETVLGIE